MSLVYKQRSKVADRVTATSEVISRCSHRTSHQPDLCPTHLTYIYSTPYYSHTLQ